MSVLRMVWFLVKVYVALVAVGFLFAMVLL